MKILITIGDQHRQATIFDSAAGRDLVAQLPLTIDMTDHGTVEKTGPLPSLLSLDGDAARRIAAMNGAIEATVEARAG